MPDLKRPKGLLAAPPQVGPVELPTEGPYNPVDQVLAGLMGQQTPGDPLSAVGAMAAFIPVTKLLAMLKAKTAPQFRGVGNLGDQILRDHTIDPSKLREIPQGSPRMREFLPVGEEGAAMKVAGVTGPDPVQAAYERILNAGGKVKLSPPGSGPKVEQKTVSWPKEEDLASLRKKYKIPEHPAEPGTPRRRKLPLGRKLDE